MESISLSELNEYIQRVIALNFEDALWVHFELSNVKESRGHLYFDCIEKVEGQEEILARSSGVIWARQMSFLRKKLKGLESDILQNGVTVLAKITVDFHPKYGFKIVVQDIDPAYTFGELAIEREKTWKRIQEEGKNLLNTVLSVQPVFKRIAILSNDTAAGYADFVAQLESNPYGYQYDLTLFETAVQGAKVKVDLPDQIEVINSEKDDFDLVVLIRGGGSRLDLQAFDQYPVVSAVAQCEVPIWVGIGHEIDESLCDLVAHQSLKTPTAVATAINDHNYNFEAIIIDLLANIQNIAIQRIKAEDQKMDFLQYEVHRLTDTILRKNEVLLDQSTTVVQHLTQQRLQKAQWSLEKAEQALSLLDPEVFLKKGFILVEKNGIRQRLGKGLKSQDAVRLHFSDKAVDAKID